MTNEKSFEVGSLQFTAIRKQIPIAHWVIRIDENGEVLEAGAGGISTESVPKMQASVQELFERVSKNDTADFRRRFGLPAQPSLTKLPMPSPTLMNGIMQRERDNGVYHDIFKDGVFIIGAQSEEEAAQRLKDLEANNWAHLDCYRNGHPDPVKWIEYVRNRNWTFRSPGIEFNKDGRMFFHGNIEEYSAAFRYLVLDQKLAERIVAMVPEVPIRRYGLDGNELPESIFDELFAEVVEELRESHPDLEDSETVAVIKENVRDDFKATGDALQDHLQLRGAIEEEIERVEFTDKLRM